MTKVAAILVGGKGTRLSSIVSDVPKPLAKIAGEPFLFLILRDLAKVGIEKVILLTGYLHEKIVEACGDGKQFGLEIIYSKEQEPLGTAGALKNASEHLKKYSEFMLLNGDTYLECSIQNLVNCSLEPNVLGVIGVSKPDGSNRFGNVVVSQETSVIESFREKDGSHTGLVSAGIYKLSSRIFDFISDGHCSLETELFPKLIEMDLHLKGFLLEGEWCDIGMPESYVAFNMNRILQAPDLTLSSRMILAAMIYEEELI